VLERGEYSNKRKNFSKGVGEKVPGSRRRQRKKKMANVKKLHSGKERGVVHGRSPDKKRKIGEGKRLP